MKGRVFAYCFYPLLLVALALILARGYQIAPDTTSYLEGHIYRTPVYPLLIASARGLFGSAYIGATFVLQNLIAMAGIVSWTLYARRALSMPTWVALLMTVLLLRPFLTLNIGNRILTEPVAYGLFLLAARSLLEGLLAGNTKRLLISFGWTALAVLTRPQLMFFYPVLGLVVVYLSLSRRQARQAVVLIPGFVVMIVGAGLVERGYHLVRHGSFTRVPFVGVQLMVPALYHAQEEDLGLLDEDDAELVREALSAARAEGLLSDSNPRRPLIGYARHYARGYNQIVWKITLGERRALGSSTRLGDPVADDRWMLSTAMRLIGARPGAYVKLYLSNVLTLLGLDYAMLMLVALGIALHRGLWLGQPAALALLLASLLHFANLGTVALVEPILSRYSFYTGVLYLGLLIAFVASQVLRNPTSQA